MERLFATHFAQRASRIMGRMAGARLPAPILKPLINAYALGMGVSMQDTEEPEGGFKTFGDFFGRRLRPGARPICEDLDAVVSPCDGEILDFGAIGSDPNATFFIKGSRYDMKSLIGDDTGSTYRDGGYLVIYLHPRDYHRVHVPVDSRLLGVRHIPGTRYPVNSWANDKVEQIYGKNERVVFHLALPSGEEFVVVMVSAFGVGNIDSRFRFGSSWDPRVSRERYFDPPSKLMRGEELGAFLLGSTVVMIWSEGVFELDDALVQGSATAMGRRLGRNKNGTTG
ncbi:MAG: phosphatidylserine decarboxylase [Deltaproteobacteria bacterium]|nr:phosphatidylserine decarboxylase [Deltaproteobacteria bacterium]